MELDDRPSPGVGHLASFKNRASFFLKDGLKIARLALVDVSAAELMTEEATNADVWGPTTKAMSDICSVIYNSEDYLRIVQVLHKRLSLSTNKYWRQIHKSLILLEYLLCHGPEHLVMEFREDKERLEELTRFVYVDWTGIDRGSALQRRAKHVLHLLMDEAFFKEERRRAQKTSKVISGFGSQSFYHRTAREERPGSHAHSKSDSDLLENDSDEDASTLLVDEDDQPRSKPDDTKKNFTNPDGDTSSPVSQRESTWGAFSTMSPGDSQSASGRSTISNTSESNPYEDSPKSVLSSRKNLAHVLDMDSLASELKPSAVENPPTVPHPPLMIDYKCVMLRPPSSQLPVSPRGEEGSSVQKLPPPPAVAEYKCLTPQSGARVRRTQPGSVKPTHAISDLILI